MSVIELDRNDLAVSAPAECNPDTHAPRMTGIVTGTLVGLKDGQDALVTYPGQPGTAAIAARTTVDLHGPHIGRDVALMFEDGDPHRPIVVGRLRGAREGTGELPTPVDVEADGERMIVTAKEQLVLRCGKASITLTRSGRVLISGAYVLSHSTGTNRIKGGSVQLN
jgi:hypothetical protein